MATDRTGGDRVVCARRWAETVEKVGAVRRGGSSGATTRDGGNRGRGRNRHHRRHRGRCRDSRGRSRDHGRGRPRCHLRRRSRTRHGSHRLPRRRSRAHRHR